MHTHPLFLASHFFSSYLIFTTFFFYNQLKVLILPTLFQITVLNILLDFILEGYWMRNTRMFLCVTFHSLRNFSFSKKNRLTLYFLEAHNLMVYFDSAPPKHRKFVVGLSPYRKTIEFSDYVEAIDLQVFKQCICNTLSTLKWLLVVRSPCSDSSPVVSWVYISAWIQ